MIILSLADQHPVRTKSQGIYNISLGIARELDRRGESLMILSNREVTRDLQGSGNKTVLVEYSWANDGNRGRVYWDQWGAYAAAGKSPSDVLIFPKGFLSFMRRPRVRTVAYIHDVMLAYYERKYPAYFSWFERWYFKKSLKATLRYAEVVVTNTEFSRQEIFKWMEQERLPKREVTVVGYGFPETLIQEKKKREGVLLMLQSAPHKLCQSVIQLLDQTRGNEIVSTVGSAPAGLQLPEGPGWKHHGRVHPSKLKEILDSVKVLIYSSEYEGFGMPPVEAALAGVAPVFSSIPPLQEVMGEVGYAYENGDVESFRTALERALATPESLLLEWGETLRKRHSFAKTVDKILQTIK